MLNGEDIWQERIKLSRISFPKTSSLPNNAKTFYNIATTFNILYIEQGWWQCDQLKVAKCLSKLPKNDFTRKMKDFNTLQKWPKNVGNFG